MIDREALKYLSLPCVILLLIGVYSCNRDDGHMTAQDYILKAQKYYREGDIDETIKTYKQALKRYPSEANMHFALGEVYFLEHKRTYNEAQKKLTPLFLRNGGNRLSEDETEKALIRNGLKKEYSELAQKEFQAAIRIDPDNWLAREHIAGFYFGQRKYEDAIREYGMVISLNPQDTRAFTSIGHVYLKKGSYRVAVINLKKALALEPSDEYTYYLLGLAYRRMNEGQEFYDVLMKLKKMNSVWYDDLRLDTFGETVIP